MNKPTAPTSQRVRSAQSARKSGAKSASVPGESSLPGTRPTTVGLTGEELNDLNHQLAPALGRAAEFEALWSVASKNGDYVAATAAGLSAAACRAVVKEIHSAWFRIRTMVHAIENIDRPLGATDVVEDSDPNESSAQALDRLVAEIEQSDAETLASLKTLVPRTGDRTVRERLRTIRECPEWTNPTGILCDHPASGCVILFRTLLVSPLVYMEVREDLAKISRFRGEAIAFREKIGVLERELRESSDHRKVAAPDRLALPRLSRDESDTFRDLLDVVCAPEVKARHRHKDSERVATIRAIADHFRAYQNLSRPVASAQFKVEPWSTGIAVLARAALNYKISTEDVRGALKNWASD